MENKLIEQPQTKPNLKFTIERLDTEQEHSVRELRSGDLCPKCREALLDYDGLLNLACPGCGYAVGGCFT